MAQSSNSLIINWDKPHSFLENGKEIKIPTCSSCQLLNEIPFYSEELKKGYNGFVDVKITNFKTIPLESGELAFFKTHLSKITAQPDFKIYPVADRGQITYYLEGVPLIKENNTVKKITEINYTITERPFPLKAKSFVNSSVLGDPSKKWYKIAVRNDGIYKIDKSFLASMGINVANLNPKHLHIYGNGTGKLPIQNSVERPDDLVKNPIYIKGEEDGVFDEGDYLLFHGFGPSKWAYTNNQYRRELNPYTSDAYYFLCVSSSEPPLRIGEDAIEQAETATITTYDYSLIHEKDERNLLHAGQRFYGEEFDTYLTHSFSFSIPDFIPTEGMLSVSYAAQNAFSGSLMKIFLNNTLLGSDIIPTSSSKEYARSVKAYNFTPNTSSVTIKLEVNRTNPSVVAYLDKIELFVTRKLKFFGETMYFRTRENLGASNINKYVLSNLPTSAEVWDVTNRRNPRKVAGQFSGGDFVFKAKADVVREFIAFTPSSYKKPTFIKEVTPQNLHALPYAKILIVTHSNFLSAANRLANLHRDNGESVHVVTTEQVYNEFSGGQVDPVGIRFFAKMFYDRANGNTDLIPDNLLLFGNGHYDPRGIVEGTDYVVTYQAENSETEINAYVSDDFFVILDDIEGFSSADKLDMGVGRMPVSSVNEANILVGKAESYMRNMYHTKSTHGDWRTRFSLIADAEDYFVTNDTEKIYENVKNNYPELNATKIYADAHAQQITAGGVRYPEMEGNINRTVEEGALVITYVGHGGPKGAGASRFIHHDQINNWDNPDKLHLFVSATCDFARIDRMDIESAGTLNLLNPKGGAIATMTTTRSIYYTVNTDVDTNFYKEVFVRDANYRPRTFGEIFRQTKNKSSSNDNKRCFILLGDPALTLALPKFKVVTDSINGIEMSNPNLDTLKALSKITIKGHLTDASGVLLNNFNGVIVPSVFDKEKLNKTLGQMAETTVMDFYTQNNLLYKGNVSVKEGRFEYSFIVPKDINYQFGEGKITYYADNKVIDAGGVASGVIVGGIDPNGIQDNTPPEIEMFLNDETFVNGGLTDENPVFKANLKDDFGINAVGNGVGHDITLILDGNESKPISLNNYYVADLDSYQSGKVNYQLTGLSEGKHTLKLKVWDVNNNPAEAMLDFVVAKKKELALEHVLNYPNPFTTSTHFYFEHNQLNDILETQIQIFTVSGKLVKTLNQYVQNSGFRSDGIHWDGRDDFGDQLAKGVYIYTLSVTDSSGKKVSKTDKLVILK